MKGLTGNDDKVEEITEQDHHLKTSVKRENIRGDRTSKVNGPETSLGPVNAVAIVNNSIIAEPDKLDEQIKSMMTVTEVRTSDGHRLATCNICGKEAPSNNMPSHIEANHITGVTHSCNICSKTSRSRNALKMHKHNYHKALLHDVVGTSKA